MSQYPDADDPRFVADGMLGRLAQWLRILGIDCVYFKDAPDPDLRRLAESDRRILLTRDTRLAAAAGNRAFFVHYQRYPDQVRELLAAFPALDRPDRVFTRCVACNGALSEIPKSEAAGALRLLEEIRQGEMGRSRF